MIIMIVAYFFGPPCSVRKTKVTARSLQYRGFGKERLRRRIFKRFPKTVSNSANVTFCNSVPQSGSGDR